MNPPMLSVLRILVLVATMVATSGIAPVYAACDSGAEEHAGGACDDETCPPGAVCSTCPSGAAVAPPLSPPISIARPAPLSAPVPTATWRLVPSPTVSDIFHPPRAHA